MSRVLGGMRRAGASANGKGASARRLAISALCVSLLTLLAAGSTSASESPLRSWGSNGYGQPGLGDTDNRLAPAVVAFFAGTAINGVTGGNHSLATTDDGALWAWGRNSHGQLGLGDATSRSSPERVASLSSRTTTAIAAGLDFSLALTSDHTVWAWGRNQNGQLGLGDTTNRNVPTEVTALAGKSVVSLAACNTHAFALTSDGKLWAWGANGSGQLGLGYTSTSVTTPTEVAALSGVTVSSISAGYYHSAAITADGWRGARTHTDSSGSATPPTAQVRRWFRRSSE